MDLNLPNVPGQPVHPQPGIPVSGFNIPPCGPPPADSSADALPDKITNNMQVCVCVRGGGGESVCE